MLGQQRQWKIRKEAAVSNLLRLVLSLGVLLIGLSGCDSGGSSGSSGEDTTDGDLDWPSANPPEGWTLKVYDHNFDGTPIMSMYREGTQLGSGQYHQKGSASVTVDISRSLHTPEEFLEPRLAASETNRRLEDRVIDGVTFIGFTGRAYFADGTNVHFNKWFGQIEPRYTIIILESTGNEEPSILTELTTLTDTINWPEDNAWAKHKWNVVY